MTILLRSAAALALLYAATAHADPGNPRDPWEGMNRKVFVFNDKLDTWVMKPVATGYRKVTPGFVRSSVTHFFNNLHDVEDVFNFALQGDLRDSRDNLLRVIGNTTVGLGGLLDPASAGGIPNHDTDFGTTLGKWGVHSGNYLVLPVLGPSTVRATVGLPVDWTLHPLEAPLTVFPDTVTRYSLEALDFIDIRAGLLDFDQAIIGDRYSFIRDAYLQHSDFHVKGNAARDPFLDDSGDDAAGGNGDAAPAAPAAPATPAATP